MVKDFALSYTESIGGAAGKLDCSRENDWTATMEGVLGGLAHHIGNRVAVLSGVADILSQDESIPPILRALVDEVPKLERGIRLLRLLVREEDVTDEALELWRVVEDAAAIARMHPAMQREIVVERSEVAPVYGRPNQILRDVVGMLILAGTRPHDVPVEADMMAAFRAVPLVIRFCELGGAVRIEAGEEELWVKALV